MNSVSGLIDWGQLAAAEGQVVLSRDGLEARVVLPNSASVLHVQE